MLVAETEGKIIYECQNSEDYLTSAIFGHLRYIMPGPFWESLFGHAKDSTDSASSLFSKLVDDGFDLLSYSNLTIKFWPKYKDIGEPDLLLIFSGSNQPNLRILIEVKLLGEKHNQNDKDDQLGRYMSLLGGVADYMVYLTPRNSLSEIQETFRKCPHQECNRDKLFRLQWQELLQVTRELDCGNDPLSKQILADVRRFLERRGLEFFEGFRQRLDLQAIKTPRSFFEAT